MLTSPWSALGRHRFSLFLSLYGGYEYSFLLCFGVAHDPVRMIREPRLPYIRRFTRGTAATVIRRMWCCLVVVIGQSRLGWSDRRVGCGH